MAEDQEFTVTLRPTRMGFRRADKPDGPQWLRLWEGETNTGQRFAMLSYRFFCKEMTGFVGFDYEPVDISQLDVIPDDEGRAVLDAVGEMMDFGS